MPDLWLDHVAIAVPDLEGALQFWRDQLGVTVEGIEEVPTEGVRVAFLNTGEGKTELLEATRPDSAVAQFLASGRKGIHHVAYRVKDLAATLEHLRDQGVVLTAAEPTDGSRGTRVAFVHPQSSGGVLIELIEAPEREGNGEGA